MNQLKPGDLVCVEYYSIKLYGKLIRVEGKTLYYRNELGQVFSAALEDLCEPEPEMLDFLDF